MSSTISISIKNNKLSDKEKHGIVYPELRSAPAIGDTLGNANDQNLNKMFGSEVSSFYNRDRNSIASVALSYFSGMEHYNLGENDLFSIDPESNPLIIRLRQKKDDIDQDNILTDEQKEEYKSIIDKQISEILLSVNDNNEESLGDRIDAEGNTLPEEDNFNPDFAESTIRWRYISSDVDLNRSTDGVSGRSHPNISFPMHAINNDTGVFNLETSIAAPAVSGKDNNFGTGRGQDLSREAADINKVVQKYIP